jgi:glycerophosphoryl diester phosphodiesterase
MLIGGTERAMAQGGGRKFELSGHRGARGLCPENTLPAFSKALSIGVSTLEMDSAVTKDGVVVISHDLFLDAKITRGRDGKWIEGGRRLIKELTLRELQEYDVGRIRPDIEYAKEFAGQTPVDGTRIPTLSAVIDLVRSSGIKTVEISVEPKFDPTDETNPTLDRESLAAAMIEAVSRANFVKRTYIQSFDWPLLQIFQRRAPEFRTVYLTSSQGADDTLNIGSPTRSKWTGDFDVNQYKSVAEAVKAAGGRHWSPDWRDIDEAQVKNAHVLGVRVIVWTVDGSEEMRKLIDMGVDGIITDYPDRLRKILIDKGIAAPKAARTMGKRGLCRLTG